jgi:hypothetical protein
MGVKKTDSRAHKHTNMMPSLAGAVAPSMQDFHSGQISDIPLLAKPQ